MAVASLPRHYLLQAFLNRMQCMSVVPHFTIARKWKLNPALALGACALMYLTLMGTAVAEQQAFTVCVESGLRQDQTVAGKLTPDQVALARLSRGAARMAMGDQILASNDYQEAIKHYESAINPKEPDA